MKLSRNRLLAIVAVSLGSAGFAVAGGWGATTNIVGYYVWANSFAAITTSNNQNPDNCTNSYYLVIDQTQPNFKEIWAAVITAQSTGQTVSLSYSGCSGSYPLINAVAVPHVW